MTEESTTPDLAELSRRFREAVNRLDFDAVIRFFAPDAVFRAAGGNTFQGRAAIRGFIEDVAAPFDDLHGELEQLVDLGNGVAFSVVILTGHPVGSSAELRVRYASVGVWTEGVIELATDYLDNFDEARADAERLAAERG